uniref:BH3-interacting domain death agonist n=1 Tax=Nothobranchius furzeri TaxID=105023 RepID=A0A8C6KVT2_NOTFU
MDISGSLASSEDAARVIVAFLQADCIDQLYRNELISLCNELAVEWAINRHEHQVNTPDHGELEADGHLPGRITLSIDDIQPQVDPQPLGKSPYALTNAAVVSASQHWKDHLADEVDQLMKRGVVLEHLHQERVIMALTLTLVKGICVQTPQLLRMLFTTVHQLVCCAGSR